MPRRAPRELSDKKRGGSGFAPPPVSGNLALQPEAEEPEQRPNLRVLPSGDERDNAPEQQVPLDKPEAERTALPETTSLTDSGDTQRRFGVIQGGGQTSERTGKLATVKNQPKPDKKTEEQEQPGYDFHCAKGDFVGL